MHPRRVVLTVLAALFTAASIAQAEKAPSPVSTEPTEAAASAPKPIPALEPLHGDGRVIGRRPTPMVSEILTALDEQRLVLRALKAKLAGARDARQVLELHKAISAAKQETELRLLRIQADHARREGRLELAANLDAAIATMTAPPVAREAAPAASTRAVAR